MNDLRQTLASITQQNKRLSQLIATQPDKHKAIRQLTDEVVDIVRSLTPIAKNSAVHLQAAHQQARPFLERLCAFDPTAEIVVNENHYSYTPRKILRRVLDHNIDHLNHIEQLLLWQRGNFTPTPADGWASSTVTFPDDLMPLREDELKAWLWRIDITLQTTVLRLSALTEAQLHWLPPDGGWTIFTIIHHLAGAELYYATSLEHVLPSDTAQRLHEAAERVQLAAEREINRTLPPDQFYFYNEAESSLPTLLETVLKQQQAI
jgi:hypothetical protein